MELKQATSDKSKRLIDAMKTVTRLSGRIQPLLVFGASPSQIYDAVLQCIAEAPTEDAAPVVHGQFRQTNEEIENYGYCYICMGCGATMMVEDTKCHDTAPNWCALCGAKMEKCENASPKSEEENE